MENLQQIMACCEQWPNCEGHMDIYEEIIAKEAIESLLEKVEPISEEKTSKNGEPTSLINAIKRANGDIS